MLSGNTATLTNTIVANNVAGGAASDITGQNVTGSYDLIGSDGSGGLTAANHDLLNVADPLGGAGRLRRHHGNHRTLARQPRHRWRYNGGRNQHRPAR